MRCRRSSRRRQAMPAPASSTGPAGVGGVVGLFGGNLFVSFFVALLTATATLALWAELLVRDAAVYVVVLMLPLFFAAMVWPARRIWAVRAVELLVALILSKFVDRRRADARRRRPRPHALPRTGLRAHRRDARHAGRVLAVGSHAAASAAGAGRRRSRGGLRGARACEACRSPPGDAAGSAATTLAARRWAAWPGGGRRRRTQEAGERRGQDDTEAAAAGEADKSRRAPGARRSGRRRHAPAAAGRGRRGPPVSAAADRHGARIDTSQAGGPRAADGRRPGRGRASRRRPAAPGGRAADHSDRAGGPIHRPLPGAGTEWPAMNLGRPGRTPDSPRRPPCPSGARGMSDRSDDLHVRAARAAGPVRPGPRRTGGLLVIAAVSTSSVWTRSHRRPVRSSPGPSGSPRPRPRLCPAPRTDPGGVAPHRRGVCLRRVRPRRPVAVNRPGGREPQPASPIPPGSSRAPHRRSRRPP